MLKTIGMMTVEVLKLNAIVLSIGVELMYVYIQFYIKP